MNSVLQGAADQIAGTLIEEIAPGHQLARPPYQDMVDRLGKMVGEEVGTWIEKMNADTGAEVRAVLDRLLEVAKKLEKLYSQMDSDSGKAGGTSFCPTSNTPSPSTRMLSHC